MKARRLLRACLEKDPKLRFPIEALNLIDPDDADPEDGETLDTLELWNRRTSVIPQWSAPCGGTLTNPGKPTGAITKIRGGDRLHLRIREMAFHPGFYRVALSVNSRSELPPDPDAVSEPGTNGRQRSVSGAIHYPPAPPQVHLANYLQLQGLLVR